MKKRLICILLALSMAAALAACGGDEPGAQNTEGQASPSQSGGAVQADGFVFAVSSAGGYVVALSADMAGVLAVLGEPRSYYEAASCGFEGLDKFYTYSGFQITTEPGADGGDYVNSILLTDDSVTTPEGVHIGSSADDVTAAYGEGIRTANVISYVKGSTSMNFILEDDVVVSIEYLPA